MFVCKIVILLPAVDDEGAPYPSPEECSALMPSCMQLGSHAAPSAYLRLQAANKVRCVDFRYERTRDDFEKSESVML